MTDWYGTQLPAPTYRYGAPGPAPYRVAHRPWSTILIVVHSFVVAFGLLVLGLGLLLLAFSAIPEEPAPDQVGFGSWLPFAGGVLAIGGLVVGLPAVAVIMLTIKGRRPADQGHPRMLLTAGLIVVALTGIGVVAAAFLTDFLAALPFMALYVLPAVFLIRATRPPTA